MTSTERTPSLRARLAIVAGLGLLALTASGLYVARRARAEQERRAAAARALEQRESALRASGVDTSSLVARIRRGPHVLFLEPRSRLPALLAFTPLDPVLRAPLERGRVLTSIEAERVYAAGPQLVGLGVHAGLDGALETGAFVLDSELRVVRRFHLQGLPSRVRGSRDGTRAAATFFVTGDSYSGGGFSTRTYLLDLTGTDDVTDLEVFDVLRDGAYLDALDRNFWGVTFFDPPGRFLATVGTGAERLLVDMDERSKRGTVLHSAVECPSLAPDHRRVAFKRRVKDPEERWTIATLDLSTGVEHVLTEERRNVDDQVEWLDDAQVLYAVARPDGSGGVSSDVWVSAVDRDEPPAIFLEDARSPCVVRP